MLRSGKSIREFCWSIGTLFAILSCITGYLLSSRGAYDVPLIDYHLYAALLTSMASIAILYSYKSNRINGAPWSALFTILLLILTGHLGGTLTHGENFLSAFANEEVAESYTIEVKDPDSSRIFNDIVARIFDVKCVSCHGSKKKKGKLRMDDMTFITEGGKSGRPLLENAADNELLRRIELPSSNKEHMPPARKPQLTTEEVAIIRYWIEDGAIDTPLAQHPHRNDILDLVRTFNFNQVSQLHQIQKASKAEPVLPALDNRVFDRLKERNIVALPLGLNSTLISVNFVNVDSIIETDWEILDEIAEYIVYLRMSNHEIEIDKLIGLSKMKNLKSLHLDGTGIDLEGISNFMGLKSLELLNINHCNVDDQTLSLLDGFPSLKKVHAFGTQITLSKTRKGIPVILGNFSVPIRESDTTRIEM